MGVIFSAYERSHREGPGAPDAEYANFRIQAEAIGEQPHDSDNEVWLTSVGKSHHVSWSYSKSYAWHDLLSAALFGRGLGDVKRDRGLRGEPFSTFVTMAECGPDACVAIRNDFREQRERVAELVGKALNGEVDNDTVRECVREWHAETRQGNVFDAFMSRYDEMAAAFEVCGTGTGYWVYDLGH